MEMSLGQGHLQIESGFASEPDGDLVKLKDGMIMNDGNAEKGREKEEEDKITK